jgi:hypothetical protein
MGVAKPVEGDASDAGALGCRVDAAPQVGVTWSLPCRKAQSMSEMPPETTRTHQPYPNATMLPSLRTRSCTPQAAI